MNRSVRGWLLAALVPMWIGCGTTPTPRNAASASEAPVRVVMLVKEEAALRVALDTAREMLSGRGVPAEAVEVVVCGAASLSLVHGQPIEAELLVAHTKGVRIVACGLSLTRSGLAPESLSEAVSVVPNGIFEVIERQREGYLSITL